VQTCRERKTLSEAAVLAVNVAFEAKRALERAQSNCQDPSPLIVPLINARAAERIAIERLNNHRNIHACW
jgi:hypothetical protein